eukprot:symbB.v1.2.003927.t1/scaffold210.1/size302740/18
MAAVRGPGQAPRTGQSCFDEEDLNRQSSPENGWGEAYQYSKVESELRALADELKVKFVSLCPSFILGPERGHSDGSGFSISMVLSWMRGEQKVRSLLIADVRDVAAAHLAARRATPGQRFIVSTEVRPLPEDVAQVLKEVVSTTWGAEAAKDITATSPSQDGPACMRPGAQEVRCKERLEKIQIQCRDPLETVRDMAMHLASTLERKCFDLAKKEAGKVLQRDERGGRERGSRPWKVSYANGDTYEGEAIGPTPAQCLRHGYGVYTYSGGGRYEGEFVEDRKQGQGSFFFENGDAYEGQWYLDQMHGHGVLAHWAPEEGVVVYEGEFYEGRRSGSGRLMVREGGGLFGTWEDGLLVQGVELDFPEPAQMAVIVISDTQTVLGGNPAEWQPSEVRTWLHGLGLEEAPERAMAPSGGAQLLQAQPEELVQGGQVSSSRSELTAWRSTLEAAHQALVDACQDVMPPVGCWEQLQIAFPAVKQRLVPLAELSEIGAGRNAEWKGLAVELLPVPVQLPFSQGTPGPDALKFAAAKDWVHDLEILATLRHPNLRPLLGITLTPEGTAAQLTMIYEMGKSSKLLFELIHASFSDGSKQLLDFRTELQICLGICEGMASLSSRGLAHGALCSVNVEVLQTAGGCHARLCGIGASWWRWGWQRCLKVRGAQAKRCALGVEEVVKKYAICPVNWMAPELLRGHRPRQASDVHSFGMILWEMLFRAVPYGEFSIAQIIATVGHGRHQLRTAAAPSASAGRVFLHEVADQCMRWDVAERPSFSLLLESLRETRQADERRRAKKGVLGRLGGKTEAFLSGRFSTSSAPVPTDGPRMVRLETGEWLRVDEDLVEQYPDDEEKWRTLMAFRAKLANQPQLPDSEAAASGGGPDVTLLHPDGDGDSSFSSPGVKLELVAGEKLNKGSGTIAPQAAPRGLVFSSVGNQCLPVVQGWLQDPAATDFDMALVFYKEPASPVLEALKELTREVEGMQVFQHEGMKWPNFRYWLDLQGGAAVVAEKYDYIWVVDDDVRLPTGEISKMFQTLREHSQIAFASPSFDKESDGVWRFFDGHNPGCKLRYTNFVECTAPVLKSSMLLDPRFQPCLRAVRTGCFIDFCFHPAAGGAKDVVAVIDAVQCHHPPRTVDYPSEMRQVQDWLEHKNDDVLFDQEGVPREWWAIEPRFFQPKELDARPTHSEERLSSARWGEASECEQDCQGGVDDVGWSAERVSSASAATCASGSPVGL